MGNKKTLSAEKVEKLISILKARFEKNKKRHKDLEWAEVQARLEANPESCGRSMKWRRPAANPMLLAMIKGRANTCFMIARWKVQRAAEAFVTTGRGRSLIRTQVYGGSGKFIDRSLFNLLPWRRTSRRKTFQAPPPL